MIVADLVKILAEMPQDLPVYVAGTNYIDGDSSTSDPDPRLGFIAEDSIAESWSDTPTKRIAIKAVLLG